MAERVEGVVLAAGRSTRAGQPKALARVGAQTFLGQTVATLRAGGCERVTVVVGDELEAVRALGLDVELVHNTQVDRGMLRSLQLGLGAVLGRAPYAVVVALVDHPQVRPSTVAALIERLLAGRAAVVLPRHGEAPGHPIVLGPEGQAALRLAGDEKTVRDVVEALPTRSLVEVDDAAVLQDLDSREDVASVAGGL